MRRGVVGEAHRTKVAQYISLKKMFNLNPKAYTQGPCLDYSKLFRLLEILTKVTTDNKMNQSTVFVSRHNHSEFCLQNLNKNYLTIPIVLYF